MFFQKAIGSLRMKRRSSATLQLLLKRTVPVENVELTQVRQEKDILLLDICCKQYDASSLLHVLIGVCWFLIQFVFDLLQWSRNDTHLVLVSRLQCACVTAHRKTKGTSINKYHTVHGVLATLGMVSGNTIFKTLSFCLSGFACIQFRCLFPGLNKLQPRGYLASVHYCATVQPACLLWTSIK